LLLVGHCNPKVTAAVTAQMQKQYTNSRYLNATVIEVIGAFNSPCISLVLRAIAQALSKRAQYSAFL
jgi:4-aminobutyrate aminotransferase-like enzyme